MTIPSLMNQAGNSQTQPNQQNQEQNYSTSAEEQNYSANTTSATISASSPVQMPQNGYTASINSSNVQSTQSFTQQQCIGGAQAAAWTARGSNTLTYTQSMQPPDARAINQNYCEFMSAWIFSMNIYVKSYLYFRASNAIRNDQSATATLSPTSS